MEVKQIYSIMNTVTSEILGRENIVTEDLSNIVDVGREIFDAEAVDKYVKKLVNHIGKVVFVNRPYKGSAPSVMMDSWEYGSVVEKITAEMPKATENESWELVDGASYDPNIFYQPKVSAKFFNKKVTFEVDMSFTEKQVEQSFSNATQLNSFISMLYTAVENSITVKVDSLIMRTINNFTAETFYNAYSDGEYSGKTHIRAVNLLHEYKQINPTSTLTPATAVLDLEFLKFASYIMSDYIDRLRKISSLFNIGGKDRFTPDDRLHVVMLSKFKNAAKMFLQSDTFNDEYVALPNAESVPYWQASGMNYTFDQCSEIHVNTSSGHEVTASGILAVMFDREALGVSNPDRRVTSNFNSKAEFFTNFYKYDAGYFNDMNENFVVFYVA